MGSYLSVISYPKFDQEGIALRIEGEHEQEMISYTLQMMFSLGEENEHRMTKEEKSWSSRSDAVGEIWNMLPLLYKCPMYGKVKYIPEEKLEEYFERVLLRIRFFTSDVKSLLKKDLGDLEVLIEFANYLKEQKEKNDKQIIFVLG